MGKGDLRAWLVSYRPVQEQQVSGVCTSAERMATLDGPHHRSPLAPIAAAKQLDVGWVNGSVAVVSGRGK